MLTKMLLFQGVGSPALKMTFPKKIGRQILTPVFRQFLGIFFVKKIDGKLVISVTVFGGLLNVKSNCGGIQEDL